MGHRYSRTPADKAAQKSRTEKNKQKSPKKRQFQDPEVRAKKKALKKKVGNIISKNKI